MNGGIFSKSEKFFLDTVESMYGVTIERQFVLSSRYYDGRFGDHLLEIDGSRWHSKPSDKRRDVLKDKLAVKYGFQLHRIKLDRLRDVPMAIEQSKPLLDEIFNGNGSTKSKVPSPERLK